MTAATVASMSDDPSREYATDPRVTPDGPGRYIVTGPTGATYYVLATDSFGWIITADPNLRTVALGAGVVVGFADADQALEAAISSATRTSR